MFLAPAPSALLPALTTSLRVPSPFRHPMAVSAIPPLGTIAPRPTPAHTPIGPTHPVSVLLHSFHTSGNHTTSSPAINKKLKQMLLSAECFTFLWLLCVWSHRAVKGWPSDGGMYGHKIHTFNCLRSQGKVLTHTANGRFRFESTSDPSTPSNTIDSPCSQLQR